MDFFTKFQCRNASVDVNALVECYESSVEYQQRITEARQRKFGPCEQLEEHP